MKHINELTIDIETIPSIEQWVEEYVKEATKPSSALKKQDSINKWYEEKYAQAVEDNMAKCSFDGAMNHIICISCAVNNRDPISFYITDVADEAANLKEFYEYVSAVSMPTYIGHNIIGFDLRVLKQRSMVLCVRPPPSMPFNAKPWDESPYDTMSQWDQKNMVSLDKIAKAFGIEGKSDIDGSMIWGMFKESKFKEIAEYCEDDVRMAREVYKRMKYGE